MGASRLRVLLLFCAVLCALYGAVAAVRSTESRTHHHRHAAKVEGPSDPADPPPLLPVNAKKVDPTGADSSAESSNDPPVVPAAPLGIEDASAASGVPAPEGHKRKKHKSGGQPVYLNDDDDDSEGPHITVINNSNKLNDGFKKDHHGDASPVPEGGPAGPGTPPTGGSTVDSSHDCAKFWKADGCVRPRLPKASAKQTRCSPGFNCPDLCCEDPIIYGNCGNFWQNKGCPTKTHFPLEKESQTQCGVEEVCFGRCCRPKPFSCEHFWEKSDCPSDTHSRYDTKGSSQCDPVSTHCLELCCDPKEISCSKFYEANGGCPAGYRVNHDHDPTRCRFAFEHGEACWKRCCDSVPLGDGRCSFWGDPHVISFDNFRYNCFTPGEYLVMDNPHGDETVHNNQVKHPDPGLQHVPPFNVGMAFRAKQDIITVELVPPAWATFQLNIRYNGKLVPYPRYKIKYGPFILTPIGVLPEPNAPWQAFANDPMLGIRNTLTHTGVIVHYGNTGYNMRHFNIEVSFPNLNEKGQLQTSGLCGTWNGNPNDDFCHKAEDDCCKMWLLPREKTLFATAPAQGGPSDGKATPEIVCKTSQRLHEAQGVCTTAVGMTEDCIMEFCSGGGKSNVNELKKEINQVVTGK